MFTLNCFGQFFFILAKRLKKEKILKCRILNNKCIFEFFKRTRFSFTEVCVLLSLIELGPEVMTQNFLKSRQYI